MDEYEYNIPATDFDAEKMIADLAILDFDDSLSAIKDLLVYLIRKSETHQEKIDAQREESKRLEARIDAQREEIEALEARIALLEERR